MLVNEFLEHSAERFPDKTAIVCENKRVTYIEVEKHANSLAHALIKQEFQRQDRAAVFLEPSVESVVSIFAVLKAGGVFLVVNPQVKPEKTRYILNDCQVRILITDTKHLKELVNVLHECPSIASVVVTDYELLEEEILRNINTNIVSYTELLSESLSECPPNQCIDIDLASLVYTSGSTGIPKGVMCTHLNMVSAANSIIEYLENSPEDIILNVLPLSFDYGLYQVLMSFKFGGTVIQEKSFLYPFKIIDMIMKERVTGFPIVPAVAAILLKFKNLKKYDFSKVRYITNTAQSLPPKFITQLQKIFPYTKIYSMYGLTECKRVSFLPPEELKNRPQSVGKAIPNTEVYLVDDKGNKIEKAGEIGELVVRGANVMKGYWNLPVETNSVLKPGSIPGERVLFTGDLFKKDEEGFLYFIARKDDIIKVAGEKVSPKEIENIIYKMGDIYEAAVIGVDDEILGQAIKAFVALKKDSKLKEEDIIRYCSRHLENFMVPKYVEIRDKLPKTSHGKISKKDLGQAY